MSIINSIIEIPQVDLTRKQTRDFVINAFLKELPGTGKGPNCSKYIYTAELIAHSSILIKRPAALNKGVDFTDHVSGKRFRKRGSVDMPSHADIILDLDQKMKADSASYKGIKSLINDVFNCKYVSQIQCRKCNIVAGKLSTTEAIMAIKWLFIEQDVTYWNWSGRYMLFGGLRDNGLA